MLLMLLAVSRQEAIQEAELGTEVADAGLLEEEGATPLYPSERYVVIKPSLSQQVVVAVDRSMDFQAVVWKAFFLARALIQSMVLQHLSTLRVKLVILAVYLMLNGQPQTELTGKGATAVSLAQVVEEATMAEEVAEPTQVLEVVAAADLATCTSLKLTTWL
jgi:hypothetical protein